jgi:hypothetical protein
MAPEHAGERFRRELAPLVGIEDRPHPIFLQRNWAVANQLSHAT